MIRRHAGPAGCVRGRRRVEHAVDEEHCFSRARVGVVVGLASTASRARARAGSERGARSLCSEAVLCGDAAFSQGLRCAKLCRTSDEPCTLAGLSAPTSSCSLGAWFLVCYWTLVGKTRRSCIWGPEPPKFVVVDLCARIAAHSHAAAAHAPLRAEGSTSNSLTASSRSSARAPPTAPLPPRRRDAASRTAAAT